MKLFNKERGDWEHWAGMKQVKNVPFDSKKNQLKSEQTMQSLPHLLNSCSLELSKGGFVEHSSPT